jgi:DNA-3-methyladenine glycosylase II
MISIPIPTPFSVARTLAFLRTSSLRTPYHFAGPHWVRRLVRLEGRPVIVEFRFPPPGAKLRVAVVRETAGQKRGPAEADATGPALRRLAGSLWSLDDNLRRCYAILRGDPLMARLVTRCAGLRMIRTPDLYEALLIAVLGQQVSVASAEAVRRRLMLALGDRRRHKGMTYIGYPAPRRLSVTSPRALQALGLSRQKARYVLEIATRTAAGHLDPAAFDGLADEEAITRLTEIPGVGRWTAEVVLMRGLGRSDVFPAADLGLGRAVQRLLGRTRRPTEDELRAMAERWKGWRSYGALYLWTSLGVDA